MRDLNRFGLVAGLAAALAFGGTARAQTQGESKPESQAAQPGSAGGQETMGQQGTEMQQGTTSERQTPRSGQQGQIKASLAKDLEKLHAANRAEVHMAGMAEEKAQSADVKEYARKLVNDHKQLDEKLTSQASTYGVNLEGKEYQKAFNSAQRSMKKLESKSGTSFDKEFMSMAVKDHKRDQKDVQKATKEARKENHEDLAALLDSADAGMQGHLDEAKRIQDELKKSGSTQRQGRRGGAQ